MLNDSSVRKTRPLHPTRISVSRVNPPKEDFQPIVVSPLNHSAWSSRTFAGARTARKGASPHRVRSPVRCVWTQTDTPYIGYAGRNIQGTFAGYRDRISCRVTRWTG